MTRVVSLVPSLTETLHAWGHDPVACTRFCLRDDLPTVGGTKDPDLDAIEALAPDLVVVDREENRREDAEELVERGIEVHVLHIASLVDVGEQLPMLAARLGLDIDPPVPAAEPTATGSARSAAEPTTVTSARLAAQPTAVTSARSVVVPIWRRPWMILGPGTYGADLLGRLGFDVVGTESYQQVDELPGADLVIAPDEPYPFAERHRSELSVASEVVFVDGRDLLWWGARTSAALDRLGRQLASRS